MKKYITMFLSYLAMFLEFFISMMLAVGIILLCIRLAGSLVHIPDLDVYPNYEDLLESCFELIIGVELIRMMYYHTPDTVFEILVFAIARQIINGHSSALSSLIGVCAIAVLFATRKFLFCGFDLLEKNIFRASSRIQVINKLMACHIPCPSPSSTLNDAILEKMSEENVTPEVGTCVSVADVALRIDKMKDGKISRIEVIHAIH